MFNKIKFVFLVFILLLTNNYSYSENNILFIDIDYIFKNSNAGKKIINKIDTETKKIQNELTSYQKNVKEQKDKIISQKNILSKDEFQNKSIELEKQVIELNKLISNKNNKLNIYRNKSRIEFTKQLSKIVQEYASNNSIEMIIKKDNILIGKKNLDVTQEILNLFDKNIKSIEIKK